MVLLCTSWCSKSHPEAESDVAEVITRNLDKYKGPALEDGKVTLKFVTELMEHYRKQKKLHEKYAYQILTDVKSYFKSQPSLIDIKIADTTKFTVCGDIHGQFYDLMNMFKLNGLPSETNPYLFNGDFVDRGSFSVECIFTLFSFKLLYPDHFFLARGNHEALDMNNMYGFREEVTTKYISKMADLFNEVYNWLPLAHLLNERVLIIHGGLFSSDDISLDNIRNVERNKHPLEDSIMTELLWSDPQPKLGRAPSVRGVGCLFGPDVTNTFLERNGLDYIIRSHEVKQEGYEIAHDGKCITVFSSPNYCDVTGNLGAFLTINGHDLQPHITTFAAVPHPKVKNRNSFFDRLSQ